MFKHRLVRSLIVLVCIVALVCSCKKSGVHRSATPAATAYNISGSEILHLSNPVQLIGADAFHVFGAGGSDMVAWHMDIAREFVGNVKENPISGPTIKDSNGSYLYSLQTVVDSNRKSNRITIICAFGWDGTSPTLFTGTRPTQTAWWDAFQTVLQQWAVQFKDQPDVWLEVWNEPYNYNRTDGYTDAIWMSDMNTLVSIVRNAGNNNIVLVPCAGQGQDESVLINKGTSFLTGKTNILFDVHAYEKWLLDTNSDMGYRLGQLHQNGLPVIFGETAPINAGVLMNPQSFLDSVYYRGLSVCAWAWKYANSDQDALLDSLGLPNNTNNNNWGTLFKNVAARNRKP